jgi:hypothetical protein
LTKRKGVIAFALIWIYATIILLFLFAVATPLAMLLNTEFYAAGDNILQDIDLSEIDDTSIRTAINTSLEAAKDSTVENTNNLSFFYQYGWVFIVIVTLLIVYLFSREVVEADIR